MTTTPSDVAPTGSEPSMAELLTALAQATAVQDAVKSTVTTLRAEVEEKFRTDPDNAKSFNVHVPDVGQVATATRKKQDPVVTVTDEKKLTDWVAVHHPTEVVRTLTIELPDGFGSDAFRDAVLDALAPLKEVGAILGKPREAREIRQAYRTALLGGHPNVKTGKLEDVDMATGTVRVVDGVAVAAPPASGAFVLGQFSADAKAEVRQQLAAKDTSTLARLLGARPAVAPAEVTDTRVVVGEAEVVDEQDGEQP